MEVICSNGKKIVGGGVAEAQERWRCAREAGGSLRWESWNSKAWKAGADRQAAVPAGGLWQYCEWFQRIYSSFLIAVLV